MDIEHSNSNVLIDPARDLMTQEQQLDYTQSIRLNIVDVLAPNGSVSEDAKERRELLGVLDSIDHQVHARRQSKTDAKNADANDRTANFLAELHQHKNRTFHRSEVPIIRDVSPELDIEQDGPLSEYLLSQEANVGDTNFADFSEKFKEENPEYR